MPLGDETPSRTIYRRHRGIAVQSHSAPYILTAIQIPLQQRQYGRNDKASDSRAWSGRNASGAAKESEEQRWAR